MDEIAQRLRREADIAERSSMCLRRGCAASFIEKGRAGLLELNGPYKTSSCSGVSGQCGCVHAEARLILRMLRAGYIGAERVLLVTSSPCITCANLILESRLFTSVRWLRDTESQPEGRQLLARFLDARKSS